MPESMSHVETLARLETGQQYSLRICVVALFVAAAGFGIGYVGQLDLGWRVGWVAASVNLLSLVAFLGMKLVGNYLTSR